MSGTDNPYAGSYGNQMTATANYGGTPAKTTSSVSDASSQTPTVPAPVPLDELIKETTTANFTRDVVEASRQQPVLVDFWAPWCGPCKQLTPVIEKVVAEAGGRVKLVKMNIDDHPSVAGQLGIQSIPAVIAFVDARPVDGFMGAVPESQIRAFIDKVAGPMVDNQQAEIEAALADAKTMLEQGDLENAAGLFGAVLQADPENATALGGLANCMITAGDLAGAREVLSNLSEDLAKDAGIAAVVKKLDQIEEARKLGDPAELEQLLADNPDDHAARIKLAKIRNVEGDRDAAADHLLKVMKRDRTFDDDGARRELLQFFEVWGAMDPATLAARRKLSSILFS